MIPHGAHCYCGICEEARYVRFGNIVGAALTHGTPEILSAVAMTGIRPLCESERRALLARDASALKAHPDINLNR